MRGAATADGTRASPDTTGWSLGRALKDPAVEEPVNRWVHRPLAFLLIRPLEHVRLGLTPNRITLLSGVAGVAAGASYYHALEGGVAFTLAGAALLFLAVILDCADGMLARLRGETSRFGMLLDGMVDSVVGGSVWWGVSHTLCGQVGGDPSRAVCVLALPTILAHVAIYDSVKNRYLRAVGRDESSRAASGALERALDALYRAVYGALAAGTSGSDWQGRADPDLARRELEPALRLARWLGLGSHLAVIYLATLLSVVDPRITLAAVTLLIVVGSNVLMLAALVVWRGAWRRIRAATPEIACAP